MSLFVYILKVSAAAYIALIGIMYVLQRKLLYLPSKARPSLESFKGLYEEAQVQTKEGLSLTHWLARRGRPHVMILHGNAGSIQDRAYKFQFLTDQGFSVLLASYRGYGRNPGRPAEADIISDAALTFEWLLKEEGLTPKDVAVLGESLGSGAAIALAAKYPVKGLVFDGAYSSITDVAQSVYPFLPVRWLLKDTWDSLARIQHVRSPSLFIHSKRDSVLPFRFAEKLFQAAPEPKQSLWLERSNHNDNLESEAVQKSIIDFLRSL